jgi:predicted metal-dependent HD superfamily phosphohydrolase
VEARLAALPLALPAGQVEVLRAAYATPPRAYHDFGHVAEVLGHYAAVADGPGWTQPREVALAVLYHDAVYVAGQGDNEALSARMAIEQIARWLPETGIDVARVAWLIGLTARHGRHEPADFDTDPAPADVRNFLDCDMAILGADPARFDAYDRAITEEYRGVLPGWLFRINRKRFLQGLLARERIYLGEFFHARLEQKARRNLRRAMGA